MSEMRKQRSTTVAPEVRNRLAPVIVASPALEMSHLHLSPRGIPLEMVALWRVKLFLDQRLDLRVRPLHTVTPERRELSGLLSERA